MAQSGSDLIVPTPGGLLGIDPCNDCLTHDQKIAKLALILCIIADKARSDIDTCTADAAVEDAACMNCLNEEQLLLALLNLFQQYAVDSGYVLAADIDPSCFDCIPTKTHLGIIVRKLALWLDAIVEVPLV